MKTNFDLLIVGAGPAGMAAAITAARAGLTVAVFDEQPAVGGQVFRAIESAHLDPVLNGAHADEGRQLAAEFHATDGVAYFPRSTVWHIDLPDLNAVGEDLVQISVVKENSSQVFSGRRVLLATGAQERPMPIPGWTLPGVMSAGAAQILLKTSGAVPHRPTVIAGQGPLCWLIAVQLLRAGAQDLHFVETTPRGRLGKAISSSAWWRGLPLLHEGWKLIQEARRRKLFVIHNAKNLKILGTDHVTGISWEGGSIACRTVLLHDGVIPSTHISRALGLPHQWHSTQQYWQPTVDEWGATPHAQVAIAGDGNGIKGWQAAAGQGRLAALDAALRLGTLTAGQRDEQAAPLRGLLSKFVAARPFLDILYAPYSAPPEQIPDSTIVCRCEEVSAGQVRQAIKMGATGPNQIKAFLRAGMGPCQGRMCATTVAALTACELKVPVEHIDALRPRAPFKPLTVGALIGLQPKTAPHKKAE